VADEDQDQKTEKASERRLQEARRQGNVAVGRDAAMVSSLAAGVAVLAMAAPGLRASLVALVGASAGSLENSRPGALLPLLVRPALLTGGVVTAAALAAALATGIQTRGGFWLELAEPDPTRLFSAGRLRRLFGTEVLIDLASALVKNVALGWMLWLAIRDESVTLTRLLEADPAAQLTALFAPFARGAVKILAALLLIAGADLAITHVRFAKRMRMTRDEVKREARDDDGDPLLRMRRRRRHRELARGRIRVEVPRADVLVVNPTHIAVALRYRAGEDRAPRVTAKGKGAAAEAMRTLARNSGVPIVEDVVLARLLWKRVKVGRAVPAETYKAVAAVLAFVYRVLGRSGASEGAR
jgi:flagellar biosynthesis protein FlhB